MEKPTTPADYASWIEAYLVRVENPYGKCQEAAKEMHQMFPELRLARGHVEDGRWGRRGHWWLVAPDGTIVDPTASQFPALFDYEEWQPGTPVCVGRCMNCGEYIYAPVQTLDAPPPRKSSCSPECTKRLEEEWENDRKEFEEKYGKTRDAGKAAG